jgi:hypothetical protein
VWLLELNSELLLVFRTPKEKAKEKRRRKGETVRWRDEERREEEVSGATSPT